MTTLCNLDRLELNGKLEISNSSKKTDRAGMFLKVNLARFDLNTHRQESGTIDTSISTTNDEGLLYF